MQCAAQLGGQRRAQSTVRHPSALITNGNAQRSELIGGQRQSDFRDVCAEHATEYFARVHILTKIHRLALNPACKGQTDLCSVKIGLGQRQR